MAKLKLVGVATSTEDSRKPYALVVQFPMGNVTQPCTKEEFFRVLNEVLQDNDIKIPTVVV